MKKRKSIMISQDDYEKAQKFANDGNYSPAVITKSLLNAAINEVRHAKKTGTVPEKVKRLNPAVIESRGEFSNTYSDYLLFCALHYLKIGKISEKQFEEHLDNLPFFIFASSMDNIELDPSLSPEITEKEKEILLLEERLRFLKAEQMIEEAKTVKK